MRTASLIGKIINKYKIVSLLGEGGMGAVFVAEHQTIGRRVALKVLQPELAVKPEIVERFLNEARATNKIRHPAIVDIYDCDNDPQIGAYLVMELLEGHDLQRFCKPDALLPIADAIALATQVGDALGAAHKNQIVHRDLKPANVFVCRDPDKPAERRIKVLDFGIAKLLGDASGPHTQTGSLIGTPAYMSPEQCHGAKTVDHRTDIYALGTIAFELLCGRPPFVGEGYGALIAMHLHDPPPSLRSLAPGIPEALEQAVLQALAKSPQERYQSMEAFVNALNNAVAHLPPTQAGSAGSPAGAATSEPTGVPQTRIARAQVPPTMPSTPPPSAVLAQPVTTGAMEPRSRNAVVIAAACLVLVVAGVVGYALLSGDGGGGARLPPDAALASALGRPDAESASKGTQDASVPATRENEQQQQQPNIGSAGPATGPCAASWKPATSASPKLVRVATRRSGQMIVGFDLNSVVTEQASSGRGGITGKDNLARLLRGCGDSPGGRFAKPGAAVMDPLTGLRAEITKVEPAGKTGRSWPGVRCSYRISDPQDGSRYVELVGGKDVPAFNELAALVRQGDRLFATLQFNGYAREVGGKGNVVVAMDLCTHEVIWRSKDMVANGELLALGDEQHLISSYGFTAEPDYLYLLDAGTGKIVDRSKLPKAAGALRLAADKLYVRIYDGYLIYRLGSRIR